MVIGQVGGAGLTVAVPVGVHNLGVQGAAGDVGGGDVILLLGQQILEEGGTCNKQIEVHKFQAHLKYARCQTLTSQNEGKEGDGQSLQRDELDDGEHDLDNDRLLQFQNQQQWQQHFLHALAARFCVCVEKKGEIGNRIVIRNAAQKYAKPAG